jgi:hypothetical protein
MVGAREDHARPFPAGRAGGHVSRARKVGQHHGRYCSKGRHWYAWAVIATASSRHLLLVRRRITTGEVASCYRYLPEGQAVSLSRLVRAAVAARAGGGGLRVR